MSEPQIKYHFSPCTRDDRAQALRWVDWNNSNADYDVWARVLPPQQMIAVHDDKGACVRSLEHERAHTPTTQTNRYSA
jgi:hypothetical protein